MSLHEGIDAFENEQYVKALQLLLPLAALGSAKAQCYVGTMYHLGLAGPVNGPEAVKWYELAALQEVKDECLSGIAYHNLETIYTTGLPDVDRDLTLAAEYGRKAKDFGFVAG